MPELSSLAQGATLGMAVTMMLFVWGPLASGDGVRVTTLVLAWAATIASMSATRVFVTVLHGLLKAGATSQSATRVTAGAYKDEERESDVRGANLTPVALGQDRPAK